MASELPYQILRTPSIYSSDRIQKHSPTHHAPTVRSTSSISNGHSNNVHNSRSCITCRRRKVKCDKKHPCSNCTKAHIECVFPAPGRAPRKPRKTSDGDLMDRLRRLEGMVQNLAQGEEEVQKSPNQDGKENKAEEKGLTLEEDVSKLSEACRQLKEMKRKQMEQEAAKDPINGLNQRFGRLVVDEGRSRYINNSFWANLNNEVEDIKGILNDSSDEDDDYPSSEISNSTKSHQGYIFGFSSTDVDMLSLHPVPELVPKYWEIFKEDVDPLVKVLHIPTIEPTILAAATRLGKIHKGLEALMFAIYYSATTALQREDCLQILGEDKDELIARYRFGTEQALARADFLQTDEVIVLQSFVLFLISLRRNDDARVIWTLTGLVVRIAQTLGIHRDGSHFDLSPFQIEMRRRLWWQVCILDARASEDHGCDPTIVEQLFDTQMPLNVNDSDLSPDMKEFPEPRVGCTEMTFGLVRFEIANMLWRLQYTPPGPKKCGQYLSSVTLETKERLITECLQRLEERYLQHCDMSVPLYWVIATVSRLIMSKMWLLIYHPYQRLDGGASLPQETKDKLFVTSLENVEYSLLLETETRTKKWGWLFRTYVQWHAIAFLLSELCVRTTGENVERAWRAIETITVRNWGGNAADAKMKGHLWRPLRKLMAKARAARERALAEEGDLPSSVTSAPFASFDSGVDPQYSFQLTAGSPSYWVDPSVMLDVSPDMTQPLPQFNAVDAIAAPPLQMNEQTDMGLDFYLSGPNSVNMSPPLGDDTVNWANWDDMVKRFGTEIDQAQNQPVNYGPGFAGVSTWY